MFSFSKQKKVVDLCPYISKLCNFTTPNLPTVDGTRSENRYNRTIPTLIGPWENGRPVMEECGIALTSDLSDRGIGIVLSQPFHGENVIVGYWACLELTPEPWYFLGRVRRHAAIGGGFWTLGVELTEFANRTHSEEVAKLKPKAQRLLPHADLVDLGSPTPELPTPSDVSAANC